MAWHLSGKCEVVEALVPKKVRNKYHGKPRISIKQKHVIIMCHVAYKGAKHWLIKQHSEHQAQLFQYTRVCKGVQG